MTERDKPSINVETMPLHELRARVQQVHRLLRVARDEVHGSLAGASQGKVEQCIARLHAIFGEVQELLPGLVRDRVDEAGPPSIAGPAAPPEDDDPAASLTAEEVARAKQLLKELREGMERMDLLDSIGRGIDELLEMIEAGRAELRRQAELELAATLPDGRPAATNVPRPGADS
jgi:hypothetical protein